MLQAIRERATGWIAWIIVILICVPFALWGIQEYLGGGAEPVAAKVDGREITDRELEQRFQRFRQDLRQRLGASYRPELFDDKRMRAQVLQSMIRETVMLTAALGMGMRIDDAEVRQEIRNTPYFQKDGRFDQETYQRLLRYQGLKSAQFESQIRQSLLSEQLNAAVTGSELVTPTELRELVRLTEQTRDISYLRVPVRVDDEADDSIGDDEVRGYYDANPDAFRTPERVRIEYLEVDSTVIGATAEADEETLKELYEEQKGLYSTPEKRRASHILIRVPAGADDETRQQARARIDAALARVRAGEPFEQVAAEISEDPGSAGDGGDLSWFERGVMDNAFEEVAFGLETGEISEPVLSRFGWHVIKLTDVQPGGTKPFDEVRDEVLSAYQKREGERQFYEFAERLHELSYENPDTLSPAASALGLKVQRTDWVPRSGEREGLFSNPPVMAAAFSDDVLRNGNNSDPVELGPEHVVVLRVVDHEESAVKPLSDVRAEIIRAIKAKRAKESARLKGEALLARLRDGEGLETLADESGYSVENFDGLKRNGSTAPREIALAAFELPRPQGGHPAYGQAILGAGDFAVIAVRAVHDGSLDSLDEASRQARVVGLERNLGNDTMNRLGDEFLGRADVEVLVKPETVQP